MTMKLEHLSLTNARRFGKQFSLDISKTATIIVAPNGTGKTTVMEAIEFAVTGRIKRLGNNIRTFMGKDKKEVSVIAKFSENTCFTATYSNTTDVNWSGPIHGFLSAEIESISSYFHLTHLMGQHGDNWFISKNPEDAGALLSQVQIGNELLIITQKRDALLKAITSKRSQFNKDIESEKENLRRLDVEIEKSRNTAVSIETKSFDDILNELKGIIDFINAKSNYSTLTTLTDLDVFIAMLNAECKQMLDRLTADSSILKSLESDFQSYAIDRASLSDIEEKSGLLAQEKLENTNLIYQLEMNLTEKSKQITAANNEIESLSIELSKKIEHNHCQSEKQSLEIELIEIETKHKELIDEKAATDASIKKIYVIQSQLESIANEERQLAQIELESFHLSTKLSAWESIEISLENLRVEKLPNAIAALQNADSELIEADAVCKEYEKTYVELKDRTNVLKKTYGAIANAVREISESISDTRCECPVCLSNFSANELRNRIDSALQVTDPILSQAVEQFKIATEKYEIAKESYNKKRAEHALCLSSVTNIESDIGRSENSISTTYLSAFPNCTGLSDASIEVKTRIASIVSRRDEFNHTKALLNSSLGEMNFELLLTESKTRDGECARLSDNIKILQNKLRDLKIMIDEFGANLKDASEESLIALIANRRLEVDKIKSELQQIDENLSQQRAKENSLRNSELQLSLQKSIAKINYDKFIQRLIHANFDASAKTEDINTACIQNNQKLSQIEMVLTNLERLSINVVSAKAKEKQIASEIELSKICGEYSPEEYLFFLETKVSELNNNQRIFEEDAQRIKNLLDEAKTQQDNLAAIMDSIKPLWHSLIKRLIHSAFLTEQFALKSKRIRHHMYSEVSTEFNSGKATILEIASEAQLTDFQLTFMISMALSVKWTPWKCLLLDDPTQYHDLVHCSSVFDLLRDMIMEYDFQLILTTHDMMQAKFLKRKLQNDGIDAIIYQLESGGEGISKKLIQ